jgi:probable F420-dependent oxidoreductase
MRIGILLIAPLSGVGDSTANPGFLLETATHIEDLGFDSLWLADHVVCPVDYATRYPFQDYDGPEDWKPFPYEQADWPEPLISLSAVAAVTSRIALCTGVLVLPARNPVMLAKQAATLDRISNGRLELGVGLGWWREEVEAAGGTWEGRGRFVEETLTAMRRLWTEDVASFDGDLVKFPGVRCLPKPARLGGVKIMLGGTNELTARRAGRLADAFIPHPPGPESDHLAVTMREAAEEAGRDPASIELAAIAPEGAPGRLEDLREQGFGHVYVPVEAGSVEHAKARLEDLAEALRPGSDAAR